MTGLRRALLEAIDGRQKVVAFEAFPEAREATAQSELSKILAGERGDAVFRVLDAILKFGDRAKLRAYFDGRLRNVDPMQIVDRVEELGSQLDLFGAQIVEIKELLEEHASVLPFKRKERS